jgi:1-phosphofructokinase
MIYTLTLSPSLDYRFSCPEVKVGEIVHAHHPEFFAGGKGINVSRCLTKLGVPNLALGFIGGTSGETIKKALDSFGVKHDFIPIEGDTRINVKITSDKTETAFNLDGPVISEAKLNELFTRLDKLEFGDILIMGGSTGMIHRSVYGEIIAKYNTKGILCVLDASGVALKEGVKSKPFLIKPNLDELSELVGRNVGLDEVEEVGKEVMDEYGINYVLISKGREGGTLISPAGVISEKFTSLGEKIVSTVGAGDCMLAGFMTKLSAGKSLEEALHYSVMCGTADCYLGHVPTDEEIKKIAGIKY